MRICLPHWDKLKQAVKAKGLFDTVVDAKELSNIIEGQLSGKKETKKNFDILFAVNNMVTCKALELGGIGMMGTPPDGSNDGNYCPICEAMKATRAPSDETEKHWTIGAVEAMCEYYKTLPDE